MKTISPRVPVYNETVIQLYSEITKEDQRFESLVDSINEKNQELSAMLESFKGVTKTLQKSRKKSILNILRK